MRNATASRRINADGTTASDVWADNAEVIPSKFAAIGAMTQGRHVVYAMRLPDGVIKIGCCKDLARRAYGLHGEILGFRFGDFAEEKAIHANLVEHRARGHEYYHPTPAVMAVVNELRDEFNLPHIAA